MTTNEILISCVMFITPLIFSFYHRGKGPILLFVTTGSVLLGPARFLTALNYETGFSSIISIEQDREYYFEALIHLGLANIIFVYLIVSSDIYKVKPINFIADRGNLICPKSSLTAITFIEMIICCAYTFFIYQQIGDRSEFLTAGGGTFMTIPMFYFMARSLLLISNNKKSLFSLFQLMLILLPLSITGAKSLLAVPLIYLVLRLLYSEGNIWFKFIVLFLSIVTLLLLMIFFSFLRYSSSIDIFLNMSQEFFSSGDFLPLIIGQIMSRFYGVEVLATLIKYGQTSVGSDMNSLFNLFISPIPRFLWETKPSVSFGQALSQGVLLPIFNGEIVSASGTILGEGAANGSILYGYLFLLISIFIFIHFIRKLSNVDKSSSLAVGFAVAFSLLIEGELVGSVIRMLISGTIFYFVGAFSALPKVQK